MATKTHPYGTTLEFSTDGNSYTLIADLAEVTPPSLERSAAKATHLGSANKTKESIPGWRDPGKIPFKAYMNATQHNTLLGHYSNETVYFYRIKLPLVGAQVTNTQWVANGYLTKLANTAAVEEQDDLFMSDCEITVTGLPVFTPGS